MVEACEGIRVLDLSSGPAGGLASMILADFGADVVKVERPGGDPYRRLAAAPMWLRGKRSIEADLKTRLGQQTLHDLVAGADVVLVSHRPDTARRLQVDAETLRALNPRLVYCHLTGFGPRGPLANYRGYEGVVAAKAGRMMTFAGQTDRDGPIFSYVQVGTHGASQAAVQGILAALIAREATGEGQTVETSLLQAMMPYDMGGILIQQLMRRFPKLFPEDPWSAFGRMPTLQYQPVLTKDGRWLQLGNLVEHLFHAFLVAADLSEVYVDERYQGPPNQYAEDAREELRDRILAKMQERTLDEWMQAFIADGNVAAEPYVTTQEALSHPQIVHNGAVIEVDTPAHGAMKQIGPVGRLSQTPASIRPVAPEVGESRTVSWPVTASPAPSADGSLQRQLRHPLEGVTILEFATIIATPYACSILGDLGARVIKVEPIGGDPMRGMVNGVGATKTTASKESISVDMKSEEGREVVRRLVEQADALIHNFRPGVPERLGIGYEDVRAVRPDIVYVSAMGYGSDGPYAHRPNAHPIPGAALGGAVMQAGGPSALAPVEGIEAIRERSRQLMRANEVNPDPNTSLVIATATMLALFAQRTRGLGQHVECDMMTANAYANFDDFLAYEGKPERPVPVPGLYGLGALYRLYETEQGWVFLACPSESEWRALVRTVDEPRLRDDRFATDVGRRDHDAELAAILSDVFCRRTADDWEQLLTLADVACVRADAAHPAQFFDRSQHMVENGFVVEADHLRWGRHWRAGPLTRLSTTTPSTGAGVLAGQHTRQILRELEFEAQEIDGMFGSGVVASELP
ncbi:MAG: CoA transferase [Dehalococcoidia bacterium]|nr:CoA transferase [Dehalococcoidia bacterium]